MKKKLAVLGEFFTVINEWNGSSIVVLHYAFSLYLNVRSTCTWSISLWCLLLNVLFLFMSKKNFFFKFIALSNTSRHKAIICTNWNIESWGWRCTCYFNAIMHLINFPIIMATRQNPLTYLIKFLVIIVIAVYDKAHTALTSMKTWLTLVVINMWQIRNCSVFASIIGKLKVYFFLFLPIYYQLRGNSRWIFCIKQNSPLHFTCVYFI